MPVPGGYGAATLDFLCAVNSIAFAIETKAPGGKMTARQELTAQQMRDKGVRVFLVDGSDESFARLKRFLDMVSSVRIVAKNGDAG